MAYSVSVQSRFNLLMRYPNFMLILVLLLLSLAACGQKGPLYLPDQQAADTQQDAEDESAEKKEKK